jgi:hypothetical protein
MKKFFDVFLYLVKYNIMMQFGIVLMINGSFYIIIECLFGYETMHLLYEIITDSMYFIAIIMRTLLPKTIIAEISEEEYENIS